MVQVGQLDLAIDVWQLLHGRILVPEIDISRPRVLLEKNAQGEANWQFSTGAKAVARSAAPAQRKEIPVVQHLELDQGHFVYNDAKIDRKAALDVSQLRVMDDRADRKVQVTGDGQFKIQVKGEAQGQGGPFAIRFFGDPWEQLQASDKPYPLDVDLTLGDLQVKTSGTVTDPVQLQEVDLKLDVRGDNTANLFAISGIALPPSPPYRFSGNVDHRGTEWRLTDGSGRMGGSDMRGTVGVDTGRERLLLKADLVSDNLLAKDLGPFIGARPGGKEGEQAAADKSKTVGRADGKILPDKEIDLGRLKAMDAEVAFRGQPYRHPGPAVRPAGDEDDARRRDAEAAARGDPHRRRDGADEPLALRIGKAGPGRHRHANRTGGSRSNSCAVAGSRNRRRHPRRPRAVARHRQIRGADPRHGQR